MVDFSEDAILIGVTYTRDEYGNQLEKETRTPVMAGRKEIAMSEFYTAAQAGIRPQYELIINAVEYSGEQYVEYLGERFSVIRIYQRNADELEIYLERKVADVNG